MTANELADINEWSCCAHSKQVSAMLRQQEDRINVLEANQKIELNIKEKALQYIAELEKEIEELKNDKNIDQMSKNDKNIDQMSKPIAWMDKNGYVYGKHETRPIEADIPLYTHYDTQSHLIEPVAMRYDFDGYGYMYIDSGSGSDWKTRKKGEFLYTKPFFQQKPVAMMVKFPGFDKPEFTTTCSSAALKHPNYTALYDHPPIAFAELEAGESIPLYEHSEDRESAIYATGYWNGIQKAKEKNETLDTRSYLIGRYDGLREISDEEILALWVKKNNLNGAKDILDFARDLLKKSSEKYCNKCNNTGWVCECHPDKEAHKCCGGAGMPCECTKESR